ncbi:MAG: histidine triad nucleotide-binding protein [Clostridia bacterium]|nr:histidine triad nucleotide-binding protein [Clostridia bacterium]
MDCLFCKIAAGEIPSTKVYEDDRILVFKDIDPKAPFHVLLIPKEHIDSAAKIDENNSSIVAHIFETAAKIAAENGLDGGFRIVTNVGEDGGQTVKHLHFHMLAGRSLAWPPG